MTDQATASRPGQMLRDLRNRRGWTLTDVSEKTGLSVSTLSKLENEKMSMSYDKMMQIATGLNIDIGVLFAAPAPGNPAPDTVPSAPQPVAGRRSITRAGEGRVHETPGQHQLYPAADLLNKNLVPIVVEVKARSLEEYGELLSHPGEEYVYVLDGTLELHSKFYAPVLLKEGDSIYFDSSMAHAYIAHGTRPCRILCVCSTVGWGEKAPDERPAMPPYMHVIERG